MQRSPVRLLRNLAEIAGGKESIWTGKNLMTPLRTQVYRCTCVSVGISKFILKDILFFLIIGIK